MHSYKYCNSHRQYFISYFWMSLPLVYPVFPSRLPATLPEQLERDYSQLKGGQGLQVGTGINTDPEVAFQSYRVEEQPSNSRRSTPVAGEECNSNGHPLPEPISQLDICCPKEGWVSQTCNQPKTTELV